MNKKEKLSFLVIILWIFFSLVGVSQGADEVYVIKADTIYTAADSIIKNGMLLVKNGKIFRLGKNVPVPQGAKELNAASVIPGLIDIHSHAGVFTLPLTPENMDGNENTNPVTPELRALDSFNFGDPHIRDGLKGGVTTIVSRPGSANVIGGTGMALKLKDARPEDMILKEICDLKMTIEYNPVEFYGRKNQAPSSLMTVYFLARKAFVEAQAYMQDWETYKQGKEAGEQKLPPQRDLGKDALVMALKREIPIHVHVITASEIMSAIRLADEFNLRLCLAHAPGAYLIVDELAARKDIHFNIGPTPLATYYQNRLKFKNSAAILANAGLSVSFQTDTVGEWQHNLLYLASMCVRYGMEEDDALKAVTLRGAEAIGLDHRIGSIKVGKDADLVLLNGEPFEMTTLVETVFVDGKIEFQTERRESKNFSASLPDKPDHLLLPSGLLQAGKFAIKGGTIFTMAGSVIQNGVILISEGKIEKIGADIVIPPDRPIINTHGFVLMPGLVNPRSYVGIGPNWRRVSSTDETSRSVFPEMEVFHAIDPQSPDFNFARQLGVTTAMVTPGNRNVIGGRGAIIKTSGDTVDDLLVKNHTVMVFGLGDAAKRQNQMPKTRMGIIHLLREKLTKVREYIEQKSLASKYDDSLEALMPVVGGDMPVMVHCEKKSDILSALRIADEFDLKLILTGATDAYKVTDELKKRNIPVILESVYRRKTYPDDKDFNPASPSILKRAGIQVSFRPEEGGNWNRPAVVWGGGDMLDLAALAVKYGMNEDEALAAITIEAARIINMDKRVGSLEPGKDADILILNGHPLRVRSLPQAVFIKGKLVYRKEKGEHTQ